MLPAQQRAVLWKMSPLVSKGPLCWYRTLIVIVLNNLSTDASLWGFMSYSKTYLKFVYAAVFVLRLGNYFAISHINKALSWWLRQSGGFENTYSIQYFCLFLPFLSTRQVSPYILLGLGFSEMHKDPGHTLWYLKGYKSFLGQDHFYFCQMQ